MLTPLKFFFWNNMGEIFKLSLIRPKKSNNHQISYKMKHFKNLFQINGPATCIEIKMHFEVDMIFFTQFKHLLHVGRAVAVV